MFDLIIKNGKLVNEGKIFESDIGIKNKRIETMKIRLEKPEAIEGAAGAGIEVERSRIEK